MKYIIKQDSETKTIVVEASGKINTKVAEEMILATGAELNHTGFHNCLFDLKKTDLDPEQKMQEMYMFAGVFKKAGINKSVKMAAVITFLDGFRLYLERAVKLEGYKLKHFTKTKDASNWLFF